MSPSNQNETGIVMLNNELELLRIDKAFELEDIKLNITNFGHAEKTIVCVDLPRNITLLNGKWRIESKFNKTFNVNCKYAPKQDWTNRFCDRGSDLCGKLKKEGFDVFRYNSFFTKNALNIIPPFKSRSPAACKYLQMLIKDKLHILGVPSNMIPLSGLDAIIGAYTAYHMMLGKKGETYNFISEFNSLDVVSAVPQYIYK